MRPEEEDNTIPVIEPKMLLGQLAEIPKHYASALKKWKLSAFAQRKVQRAYDKQYAKSFEYFRWEADRKYTKTEIEIVIFQDEDLDNLRAQLDEAMVETSFWESKMKNVREANFALRSYVEYQRQLNGG